MFKEKSFGVKILRIKMVLFLPNFFKLRFAALFKHKIRKSSRLKKDVNKQYYLPCFMKKVLGLKASLSK